MIAELTGACNCAVRAIRCGPMKKPHDPTGRWRHARREMVASQIEARGICDPRVLAAIESVPREQFVPPSMQHLAYEDRALAIEAEQTISQPYIVAFMTNALRLEEDHKVLEVGTGSGYQTAIISRLTHRVYTVERIAALSRAAKERLAVLGYQNVHQRVGDGALGWEEESPFDRIIVTAAAPAVPPALIEQLADGGRLVIPVGSAEQQRLMILDRRPGRIVERPSIPCRFVKFVGRGAWPD